MLALIDGDIVAYRCAAVVKDAAEGIAKWQADELLSRIIADVDASDWVVHISGDNNFRYSLYPEYKANRRDMVRPKHLELIREHLVLEWNAQIADGIEADDALGIASQSEQSSECVVCSIDKDLLQLPGEHYNFVQRKWTQVSSFDGWKTFYRQVLTGDATDNIKGCPGIGPVKSEKLLAKAESLSDMYRAVSQAYSEVYKEGWWEQLNLNAQLVYVLRRENDKWEPPLLSQELGTTPGPSSSGETTDTSLVLTTTEKVN
jgi:DNA polymerase-1